MNWNTYLIKTLLNKWNYLKLPKQIVLYKIKLMKKIISIQEFLTDKEFENYFEKFIPIWKNYWENIEPISKIFGQMLTSTRLLQLAITASIQNDFLDKKTKNIIIKKLENIINLLK